MSQPTREHRFDIHPRMTIGFGEISHIAWLDALDTRQPVGNCTACGGLMRPDQPYEAARRMHYPAWCASCGREVEGKGPRPAKEAKG